MQIRPFLNSLILFLSVVLCGCSMRLDRTECPCYVSLKVQTDTDCMAVFFNESGEIIERKEISAEQLCSGDNYTMVKKGYIHVSVFCGHRHMVLSDSLVISRGDIDYIGPVMACRLDGDATGESLILEGTLDKQYADINVTFIYKGEEEFPYYSDLYCSYGSFDCVSLKGCGGRMHLKNEVEDLSTIFRILRQNDDTELRLILERWDTEKIDFNINITELLVKAGYDWQKKDLDDIKFIVDCGKASITINIDDWQYSEILKVII